MKTIVKIICLFYCLFLNITSKAETITVVTNFGNWENVSTWDKNRIPATGDHVIIPSGMTVIINSNVYNSVPSYPSLKIDVYGVLQFTGSGQLNMKCPTSVCTKESGSIPSTGCNCNQITIDPGLAPWKGAYPTISNGDCVPSTCDLILPIELLSFDIVLQSGKPLLKWEIAEGNDLDFLTIERSFDGIDFSSLVVFQKEENLKEYLVEQWPFLGAYYRLQLVGEDDKVYYSPIKYMEKVESIIQLSLAPNPVATGEQVRIFFDSAKTESNSIRIYDAKGKEVYGENHFNTEVNFSSPLVPGVYFVSFCSGTTSQSTTLLVY